MYLIIVIEILARDDAPRKQESLTEATQCERADGGLSDYDSRFYRSRPLT